jgi:hypothetical protein
MQRKITDEEIQKAREVYLQRCNPFMERLSEIHKYLTPKIIQTETEVRVFYEETEEMVYIKKHLEEISNQIKTDLESGRFL